MENIKENIVYCIAKRHTAWLENCFSSKLSCEIASALRQLKSRFLSVLKQRYWPQEPVTNNNVLLSQLWILYIVLISSGICLYGFASDFSFKISYPKVKVSTCLLYTSQIEPTLSNKSAVKSTRSCL